MDIYQFIKKLQGLSNTKKKIIIFSVVIVVGLVMGFFWIKSAQNNIAKIGESIKSVALPTIDMPDLGLNIPDEVNNVSEGQALAVIPGWKIYTNAKYGYSIEYPSDWVLREYPDTQSGAAFRPSDKPNDFQYEFINVNDASRGLNYCDIPFSEYVKTAYSKEVGAGNQTLRSIEKVKNIYGVESYKTTWNSPSPWNAVPNDTNQIVVGPVTYFGSGKQDCNTPQISLDDNAYIDVYDTMITTFKFTH
jgi:hypothetical protein